MKKIFPTIVLSSLGLFTSSYIPKESPAEISRQLVYPVTGTQSNVGSVWGDERDGGKRKHEGIDIFASKGTPVVAISDGVIEVIANDDIGGLNITLQPYQYEWNAYYAHLDKLYVNTGDKVKKGQWIGTVGNTGNAKTTPPHLHFGIYTNSGAVDPLPYVKASPKLSRPVLPDKDETAKAGTEKTFPRTAAKKPKASKPIETEIKNAAVQIITGELLRRIRIRL